MEEESLKRNTDCVYFLASPFTCKKGADCEYRHSDMARLNPRDCWYWLSGNCLNPTCAFRHPPLEIHADASSEPSAPPSSLNQPSVPVTKTTVPCYFFFNGYCNKGEKCPFLHEIETEETHIWKPQLTTTLIPDTFSAPPKKNPGPSETAVASDNKSVHIQHKPPVQNPSLNKSALELNSPSAQTYVSEHDDEEEDVEEVSKSDSEEQSSGHKSSEEEVVVGREEWWDSSPGFDVLVDGKTEENTMAYYEYDDDDDALEQGHDYERGFIEYEPYERYSKPSHKRKLLPMDLHLPISGGGTRNNNNEVDLRDYLRKRRMFEFAEEEENRMRRRRLEMQQRLHRRIVSKVVERRNSTKSRPRSSHHHHHNRYIEMKPRLEMKPRRSNNNNINNHHRHRRLGFSRREERSFRGRSGQFAGPKSLAEIKQEKRGGLTRKSNRNGNGNGSLVDFEGPKPLSEILKDKNKTTTATA